MPANGRRDLIRRLKFKKKKQKLIHVAALTIIFSKLSPS